MANHTTVTLSSNRKYWQARYYDHTGQRRTKSLGAKASLSRRRAKVLCDRLAAELQMNPGKASIGRAPKLEEFLERYLESRTDLAPSTRGLHRLTVRYLLSHFGGEAQIDRISRMMASDWRAALATGRLKMSGGKKRQSEATVCIHSRNAKKMFSEAVRDDLILFNPFDRLKGATKEPDKDWHYVDAEQLQKLLNACPSRGWRMLIALCRLAGLRRGEALEATWSAVDWEKKRLTVIAQKTGSRRVIPIGPALYDLLLESFEAADEGEQLICPISHHCLWRNFQVIRRRAGLPRWKDAFKVVRRNCETDWAQQYPQYAVSIWMGHGIEVSRRHYLQVPEELYDKAASKTSKTGTKTGTNRGSEQRASS